MNRLIYLILLIVLSLVLPSILSYFKYKEGYDNYRLNNILGDYPKSESEVLVQDIYNPIGKNQISDNTSNDIWMDYPIFQVGSYKQMTNNIRYPINPDEGTCMPASMCGALYKDNKYETNIISQLPPVNNECGTRIGYFTTNKQLIDSLPFRTNLQNILY